jgi:uncharacterized membrane protein YesL
VNIKGFFAYDGPLQNFLSNLIDVFLVTLFWIVFSIPIVTAGAASAALYDTVRRVLDEERGYLWRTFFNSFKSNFRVATPAWVFHLVIFAVMFIDQLIISLGMKQGGIFPILYYLNMIFLLMVIVWEEYTYAYVSRFVDSSMHCLKNGILLMLGNFGWSLLLMLVLVLAYVLVMRVLPALLVILPAVICWINVKIIERVFQKMIPKDENSTKDENSEEEA